MVGRIKRALCKAVLSYIFFTQSALAGIGIPGQFAVSSSGAATYSIPIQIPPGVAGIEPKLALNYSSQGSNGLLGMGWSLSGLSSITRCARTLSQDGVQGSVNYDSNDRFCLDGQRLILVSGIYGADGSEYRTEFDTFAKITAVGASGTGPGYFMVRTKSGLGMEYGSLAATRMEAPNGTVAFWGINRITDRIGNCLDITYSKNPTTHELIPIQLDYACNLPLSAASANHIELLYEGRPDISIAYHAGMLHQSNYRMIGIRAKLGATVVREYRFTYSSGAVGTSLLSTLQECEANNNCRPPVSLGWQTASQTWGWISVIAGFSPAQGFNDSNVYPIFAGDVNGDGKTDICRVTGAYVDCEMWTGNGWTAYPLIWNFTPAQGLTNNNTYPIFTADINGDAKTDICRVTGSYVDCQISTGNGWTQYPKLQSFSPAQGFTDNNVYPIFTGDFNGDGRTDICRVTGAYIDCEMPTGTGWEGYPLLNDFSAAQGFSNGTTFPIFAIDLNGDGRTDICRLTNSGLKCYVSTGTGWQAYPTLSNVSPMQGSVAMTYSIVAADLNGDHKVDVCQVTASNVTCYLSTGNGWQAYPALADFSPAQGFTVGVGISPIFTMDVNGDGKTDLCRVIPSGVKCYLSTSTGWQAYPVLANFSPAQGFSNSNLYPLFTADVDGDGKSDICRVTSQNVGCSPAVNTGPDLLISVRTLDSTGIGINYQPLTNNSVYTKDQNAVYPIRDLQAPSYVVSSATIPDGIGGTRTINYTYGGLKSEAGTGRGLLGFRWTKATQQETGITAYTEYRQNFPYTGSPSLIKQSAPGAGNGGLLSQITTQYDCIKPVAGGPCTASPGQRYRPYAKNNTEAKWDLDGTALPTIITASEYDNWGNLTRTSITSSDGYVTVTDNLYAPVDTDNWYLGRLIKATVTSTTP